MKKFLSIILFVFLCLNLTCCKILSNENIAESHILSDDKKAEDNSNDNVKVEKSKGNLNVKGILSRQDFIDDSDVNIEKTPSKTRFCYQQLSDEEKLCYEKIRLAVSQRRQEFNWDNEYSSPENLEKLMMYVSYDYPEYFWYSKDNCYVESDSEGKASKIVLHYEYTNDEIYELIDKLYDSTNKFLERADNLETDYEKALYTYKYIIDNTTYDNVIANAGYNTFDEMESKDIVNCWNVTGVLVNGNAICRGYTLAYQYLMNLQGIECGYVYGEGHCWNIIKLDGDWYYTDITWGDPTLETYYPETGQTVYTELGIDYTYFCMTTEQLLEIHKPDKQLNAELPLCTATKDNYFVHSGIIG